jgi:hypothetical protein
LHGFVSANGFEPTANNDVDLDNNGLGNPFTDIMSGIVTLSSGDEPLNDGDPFNCYFNYDASGNNTVDFGFYNPAVSSSDDNLSLANHGIRFFPNPVLNELWIEGNLGIHRIEIYDSVGRILQKIDSKASSLLTIDMSLFPKGLYFVKALNQTNHHLTVQKIVKQ